MGACLSGGAPAHIVDQPNGDEEAYHKRYLEDHVLGEGEFGIVKLVHDVTQTAASAAPLACKVLRKGIVFKDNVLYAPLKPEVLRGEVEMLRTLNGRSFCLKLIGIYESARLIYMITEYCGGGEMMEYIASQTQDLRSEDVSRIAYQLLSAVDHCAKHGVLHRDIKPENIMFQDPTPKAELRLIDFGSGTMQPPKKTNEGDGGDQPAMHTTFAGSAFYISPELFQRSYNQKTDVWSAGVTLYVLVAGYPADDLQKAFNILQTSHNRNLRSLPNMPHNMPDSYYELLEGCLTYRHKKRQSAGELLQHDFVKFHRELEKEEVDEMPGLTLEEVSAAAAEAAFEMPVDASGSSLRNASVSLKGSVVRHNLFLGFKKFERSLTTVLATVLSKTELQDLVTILNDRLSAKSQQQVNIVEQDKKEDSVENALNSPMEQKLWVIPLSELKQILSSNLKNDKVLETIEKLPNAAIYNNFAYHVALLIDFSRSDNDASGSSMNSFGRRRRLGRSNSFANGFKYGNGGILTTSNSSLRSTTSLSSRNRSSSKKPSSVHGGTLFASLRPANMKRSNSLSA